MIDTASAKALLQSNNVDELRSASKEWVKYIDGSIATSSEMDDAYKNQIMKLLILVHSKLVQLTPKDDATELATSYYEIGRIWMLLGDAGKAIGQFNHSIVYSPDNVTALMAAGDAYCTTANFDTAIDHYSKAIAIQQSSSDTTAGGVEQICTLYSKLAGTYEHKADFTKALSILQQAVDLLSSNTSDSIDYMITKASVYFHIGTIQEKVGMYTDAKTSLTVAVDTMKVCYGDDHSKTQEAEFLLDMANSLCG